MSFLGREQFYNALKLVTVAQSGHELTQDIVRANLFGTKTSQIIASQISPPIIATPSPVMPSTSIIVPTIQLSVGAAQQYVPPGTNQFL